MIDPAAFETLFQGWINSSGCASAAIMPLTNESTSCLKKLPVPPEFAPDYLLKSWDLRRRPLSAFPFTKSLIAAAFPFHKLPESTPLPVSSEPLFNGNIAGYAGKIDYHIIGREKVLSLAGLLEKNINEPFKFEVCLDTAPLAERNLAELSKVGKRGYNDCILCKNEVSGCYLAFLILDLELPPITPVEITPLCPECGLCVQTCPNSVLGGDHFKLEKCISFLTMEKRGELCPEEAALLGNNIFGCSQCTAICPGTIMPDDIQVDLEWLLMSPASEVRKAIKNSSIAYAGLTLLRRNALYVLNSRNNMKCADLIKRFRQHTGSESLRNIATKISS